MAIKNQSKKSEAIKRKNSRKFINMPDAVGTVFVPEKGIWMNNGTYSPRVSIDIDEHQTLSGFTRHITLQGCKCAVVENAKGYAELVIVPDSDEFDGDLPF